jgi:hypothetical protein
MVTVASRQLGGMIAAAPSAAQAAPPPRSMTNLRSAS